MHRVLGIAPLRSFVAVSDCGGFQRAANALHLSQGAVSQHVRRLEEVLGRRLVERSGRGSSFTADGERLLERARLILDAHDAALRLFDVEPDQHLVIGTTEHAAERLLSQLRGALLETMPDRQVRFRVDRGVQLRDDLASGRIDLALLFGPDDDPAATSVGQLELTWYSAPGWSPHSGRDVPLVAFDDPCAIRDRATETLGGHGLEVEVMCEAPHLAGVQAAVRAGLGIALMATHARGADGLVAVGDLPPATPIDLALWSRPGLVPEISASVASVLRGLLVVDAPAPRELSLPHAA